MYLHCIGTRASLLEYERCNLGRIKANAIVTRGGDAYNETQLNAYINLFIYAQQFYGRKDQDDFRYNLQIVFLAYGESISSGRGGQD